MKINISERDRNILMILLVALIVFCSYYFGYKNINEMTVQTRTEKDELTQKYKSLYPMYSEMDSYVNETKKYVDEYDELMEKFPNGSTQEGMIVLAKSIEEDTDVWFSSLSMSDVTPIYTFGQIASSNPNALGANVYTSDCIGNKVTLTMSYSVTYEKGKKLIEYLNTAIDRKYAIDSMSMSYNEAEDNLSGSIVLSTFDITGSNREFPITSVRNVPVGTGNLFSSTSFAAGGVYNAAEGDGIINDYDIFVMANAYQSDMDSVVVGLANDALGKTVSSTSSNAIENVTLTVTGKNGDYKVSYKVGATTYPVDNYFDGASFVPGDTLDLLIMSSKKTTTEDKSGAKINIVNNSDKELNIKIINDDVESPRITFGTTTGAVKLFR